MRDHRADAVLAGRALAGRALVSAAVAAIMAGGLAACGAPALPRTPGNVAICAALARALHSKAGLAQLTGLTFESNEPVTHRLRQDIATYIASFAPGGDPGSGQQAASAAEHACHSMPS
jgi:hypothetical protein